MSTSLTTTLSKFLFVVVVLLLCDNYNLHWHRCCNNMSRMNLSENVGHVTIFIVKCSACCLVEGLRSELGLSLDLVSGW